VRDRVTKRKRGKDDWNGEGAQRSLEGAVLKYLCRGSCIITPLLIGPVCLLSQGRFEEPVRSWSGWFPTVRVRRQGVF